MPHSAQRRYEADAGRGALDALRTLGPRAERALVVFARENAALLALSMAFGLLAYGDALVSPGLNLDEQIAPPFGTLGHGHTWNLALYRWGMVLFDYAVLAPANLHVLRPVLALALLSVAATVYARLLPISPVARGFFCLTFVTVPSFARAMAFSFQSVEFALAILLFVLGLKTLIMATSGSYLSRRGLAATLALWVLAQSFYQDYGIVITGSLLWALFAVIADRGRATVRRAAIVPILLIASVALNLVIARALVWLAAVPEQAYLADQLGRTWFAGRARALVRGAIELYFSRKSPGWPLLGVTGIALPLLAATAPGSARQRTRLALLGVAVCVAPLVYGLGTIPPLRATSGLLFVVGGAAALAVARSPQAIAFYVKCAVIYLALQNCVAVNDFFHYESIAWESDRTLAVQLAARIYEVAPDVHDNRAVRVLFVGSYARRLSIEPVPADTWVGAFDTWGQNKTLRRQRAMANAGFPAFRLATEEDYRAALALSERMPAWPDPRSVARVGDLVVVKLGAPNGYDGM